MIGAAFKAAAAAPQPLKITAPSGRVYTWTKPTPPTQDDLDAMVAHEAVLNLPQNVHKMLGGFDGSAPTLGRTSAHGLNTEIKPGMQKPVKRSDIARKAPYPADTVAKASQLQDTDTGGGTDPLLRQSSKHPVASAPQNTASIRKGMNDTQDQLGDFIRNTPGLSQAAGILGVLGAANPVNMLHKIISGAHGAYKGPLDSITEDYNAGAGSIAQIVSTPTRVVGNALIAGAPDTTLADRLWSGADLAIDTLPAWGHEAAAGIKAIRAAVPELRSVAALKHTLMTGDRAGANALSAIGDLVKSGVSPESLKQGFGNDPFFNKAIDNMAAKVKPKGSVPVVKTPVQPPTKAPPPPETVAEAKTGALPAKEGSSVDGAAKATVQPPSSGLKAPHEMTRAEFEATGDDYLHGTPRQVETLQSGQAARAGYDKSKHVYFTTDPNVAENFANAGGKYTDWDGWLERTNDNFEGDPKAAMEAYRKAIQKRIEKGDHVTYINDDGGRSPLKDVSSLSDGDLKETSIHYAKNPPSVIKTKVYGATIDLTGDNIPDYVPDWLKQYGNKKGLPNFTHEYDPKISQWMKDNHVGKLIVGDTYESGFKSTISTDDYIGHGRDAHKAFVENALKDGKTVPANVLADYPDLAAKSETAKAAVPDTSVTGVAKQVSGKPGLPGTSVAKIAEEGKTALEEGKVNPHEVAKKVLETGKPMTDVELSATGARLRQIETRSNALLREMEQASDPVTHAAQLAEHDALQAEGETLHNAARLSLNKGFHKLGMAAQVAYKADFSLVALKARAKAAMLATTENLPKAVQERLQAFSSQVDSLTSQLEKAKTDLQKQIMSGKSGGSSMPSKVQARNIDTLQKYFGKQKGQIAETARMASKQSGAVTYTLPNPDMQAMKAVRSLAKDFAANGAGTLDDVLNGIRTATGVHVPDETLLRMLSDPYRQYLLESDVAKLKANQYMRDLQRGAEFRLRTPVKKALTVAGDLFTTTQRSMQAGMDLSAAFIQGRKGIFANPQGWLKAWKPMIEATMRGDEVALREIGDMQRHPMFAKSKAAGLDLTEPGGRFTAQEEQFGGNFVRYMIEKLPGSAKTNPLKLYFKALEHSDAAYTAFLNKLRFDTFLKLATAAPDDPAYLRDIAGTINTIYGRGASDLAKNVGRIKGAGNTFYAPRYTISSFEYASGRPLRAAETMAGRKSAMKIYAAQVGSYISLVAMAKMAGWGVDTDPRSTNFGKVEAGGTLVDLFSKEAQPFRLAAQVLYGKVNQSGKYTGPSMYNATNIAGDFLTGKMAPGARMATEHTFGKFGDDGAMRPVTINDDLMRYVPLWIQQGIQDGTFKSMPVVTGLTTTGLDIKPGKLSKSQAPPLNPAKPGIYNGK